jgi:hypothetical protein
MNYLRASHLFQIHKENVEKSRVIFFKYNSAFWDSVNAKVLSRKKRKANEISEDAHLQAIDTQNHAQLMLGDAEGVYRELRQRTRNEVIAMAQEE